MPGEVPEALAQFAGQTVAAVADRGGAAFGTLVYQRWPEAAGLPVRLAPRPTVLAGQETLLADLAVRLTPGPGRPGPRVAVLYGLDGAGKSSVAAEYAHRQLGEAGVCWQFAADDPAVLAVEFAVLATQLGVRNLADARDPVTAVHAALAEAQSRWLLIFDNVPDLASVRPFLPPAGPGQVVITSQSQHWPPGWAVQVPVLDNEVASQFLTARTGDANRGAALKLAGELGGLPLALEQAVAYMQATGTSLARYLTLLRARQAKLLARGQATGCCEQVTGTVALALARLRQDVPSAAGLLRMLAFLAPEPVPLDLLLARKHAIKQLRAKTTKAVWPLLGDPVAAGDAVAALRRYSLAVPAGDGLVQVHQLVQAITRAQLTAAQATRWKQIAAILTAWAIPDNGQPPTAWPTCTLLLPHARAVLDLTENGTWQIARALGHSGSYAAARDLSALIADAYQDSRNHGPRHFATLNARGNLASWTGAAGDAAGARDQFAVLLPDRERILGPDHPDTLATRGNLAYWTGEAGDAAGARDQFAALLPDRERILGPGHPDPLNDRATLAYWPGDAEVSAGSRDQFAALLLTHERVSGPTTPTP